MLAGLFRYSTTCSSGAKRTQLPSCCLKQHISKPLYPTLSSSNRSLSSFTVFYTNLHTNLHLSVTLSSDNSWAISDQKAKSWPLPQITKEASSKSWHANTPLSTCWLLQLPQGKKDPEEHLRSHCKSWSALYKAVLTILPLPASAHAGFWVGQEERRGYQR